MCSYFDSESTSQRIFVLHGLGGAGKSQLAFKFIEESKGKRYENRSKKIKPSFTNDLILYSFSEIFYVDATTEETIQSDLEAIAPGNAKRTVDAGLRWLLIFDNADSVDLKLKKFFPSCSSGNILITTRNRELRHYTAKDADADVKGMDLEDARSLLLVQARAESNVENNTLAETIVLVTTYMYLFIKRLTCDTGAPLLCVGRRTGRCFHSLPLVFTWVSRTLPP